MSTNNPIPDNFSFVINRDVWYRGQASGSRLLRTDGRMCCVGICLKALGVPDEALLNEPVAGSGSTKMFPAGDELARKLSKRHEKQETVPNARSIYGINDSEHITSGAIREVKIVDEFAAIGITVTFEG